MAWAQPGCRWAFRGFLLNAAVAAASFGATFALTYLLSALIRPFRKWLNA